jgi:acid-sensing ion channel, other
MAQALGRSLVLKLFFFVSTQLYFFYREFLSRLVVSFKEAQFMASKRSELYGKNEFFANCGGLLGLFMGISFMSFIELFYYFSIRLIINLCRRRKK